MAETKPMTEKTTPPGRPLEIRIRITYPRAAPEKASSQNQGKALRKGYSPWVVPLVLFFLMGGLLIFLYAHFQDPAGKPGLVLEPQIAPEGSENLIAQEAPSSNGLHSPPEAVASAPYNKEDFFQKLEASQTEPPKETPLTIAPAPKKAPTETKLKERVEARASRQEQNPSIPKTLPPKTEKPGTISEEKQPPLTLTGPETEIIRAQFTTGIKKREPIDEAGPVILAKKDLKRLYYFTEVKGMAGETLIHRWEHEGEVMAKVRFPIGGDPWRTYSSKYLTPAMTGQWRVIVTDSKGNSLHASRFVYRSP